MNVIFNQKISSELATAIKEEYKATAYSMSDTTEDGRVYALCAFDKGYYGKKNLLVLGFNDVEAFVQYAYLAANGEFERASVIAQKYNALPSENAISTDSLQHTKDGKPIAVIAKRNVTDEHNTY